MSEQKDFRVSLADSPRALVSIRRTKARGGLIGFAIGALGAWMHGAVAVDVVLRGLEGGVAGYLVCWFAAVTLWRHVIRAEVRAAIGQALEEREERKQQLALTAGAASE